MKIKSKDFRVPSGNKVNLSEWPTLVKPYLKSKDEYQKLLDKHREELSVSRIVLDALEDLKLRSPRVDPKQRAGAAENPGTTNQK